MSCGSGRSIGLVGNIKRDPFEQMISFSDSKSAMALGGALASPSTAYLYDWNMLPITIVEPDAVLFAESDTGEVVGFAELSIRTDVAGVEGQRTGYLEGLYVLPGARQQVVARKLVLASRRGRGNRSVRRLRAIARDG